MLDWCKGKCCQGRNEVRWRSGQETSLAPHVWTWDLSEANLLYWKKYLWHCWNFSAFLAVNRRPGNCAPLAPLVTPLSVVLLRNHSNVSTPRNVRPCPPCGNAITTNYAELAFPSCVETAACWRRFSKSLWRDVNQLCSSAKLQPFKYVWKISSASRKKYTTGKYETGLNWRRKLSKLQKMSLEMEVTSWASSLRKRS